MQAVPYAPHPAAMGPPYWPIAPALPTPFALPALTPGVSTFSWATSSPGMGHATTVPQGTYHLHPGRPTELFFPAPTGASSPLRPRSPAVPRGSPHPEEEPRAEVAPPPAPASPPKGGPLRSALKRPALPATTEKDVVWLDSRLQQPYHSQAEEVVVICDRHPIYQRLSFGAEGPPTDRDSPVSAADALPQASSRSVLEPVFLLPPLPLDKPPLRAPPAETPASASSSPTPHSLTGPSRWVLGERQRTAPRSSSPPLRFKEEAAPAPSLRVTAVGKENVLWHTEVDRSHLPRPKSRLPAGPPRAAPKLPKPSHHPLRATDPPAPQPQGCRYRQLTLSPGRKALMLPGGAMVPLARSPRARREEPPTPAAAPPAPKPPSAPPRPAGTASAALKRKPPRRKPAPPSTAAAQARLASLQRANRPGGHPGPLMPPQRLGSVPLPLPPGRPTPGPLPPRRETRPRGMFQCPPPPPTPPPIALPPPRRPDRLPLPAGLQSRSPSPPHLAPTPAWHHHAPPVRIAPPVVLNTPPAVPSPMRPTWRSASPMAVRAVPTESPVAVRAVPTESPAAGPAGPTESPQPTLRAAEEAVRPLASWPAPSCTVVAEEEDDDPFLLDSAADVTLVAPYLPGQEWPPSPPAPPLSVGPADRPHAQSATQFPAAAPLPRPPAPVPSPRSPSLPPTRSAHTPPSPPLPHPPAQPLPQTVVFEQPPPQPLAQPPAQPSTQPALQEPFRGDGVWANSAWMQRYVFPSPSASPGRPAPQSSPVASARSASTSGSFTPPSPRAKRGAKRPAARRVTPPPRPRYPVPACVPPLRLPNPGPDVPYPAPRSLSSSGSSSQFSGPSSPASSHHTPHIVLYLPSATQRMEAFLRRAEPAPGPGTQEWLRVLESPEPTTDDLPALLRLGVPAELRGRVWQLTSGSLRLRAEQEAAGAPGYHQYASRPLPNALVRQIGVDAGGTLPEAGIFQPGNHGYSALTGVLAAMASYDAGVSHKAGMGQVAGTLLMHMNEEEAFWVMAQMYRRFDLDMSFAANTPLAFQQCRQLEEQLAQQLPKLHRHFTKLQIRPEHFALKWFRTVLAGAFPAPLVHRVWDCFFLEGWPVVFRVILTLLRLDEHMLLAIKDRAELLSSIGRIPRHKSPDAVIGRMDDTAPPPPSSKSASRRRKGSNPISSWLNSIIRRGSSRGDAPPSSLPPTVVASERA